MVHYSNRNKIKPKQKRPPRAPPSASDESPTVEQATPLPEEPRAFEMKEIPGKGIGLLAVRDLKAGDLVLREAPILITEGRTTGDVVFKAYSKLSQSDKEAFDSLYCEEFTPRLPRFMGILKTNAIEVGVEEEGKVGVFVQGSRFNHSCSANVRKTWDLTEGVEWFIAMKDIKEGDELTQSYRDPRQKREKRKESLRAGYGFDCTCQVCSMDSERVTVSDGRREKIKELSQSTQALILKDPLKLVRNVKLALSLMEEEGVLEGRADLAFECLGVCAFYGDRFNTNRWIDKTLELDRYEGGIWSSRYRQMKSWKGQPTRHPGWNSIAAKSGARTLLGPK
ncbi:hypothetical protein JCM5350_002719 [Sporobolomyces pararoseus]